MEMMEKGELDRNKIRKRNSSFLTLDIDRKLFDKRINVLFAGFLMS